MKRNIESKTQSRHLRLHDLLFRDTFLRLKNSIEGSQMKNKLFLAILGVTMANANLADTTPVLKRVLSNGLTVLVRPVETTQKVAMQMWYYVGSKDEKSGERGLAHLLEHMIFKGTPSISECDIALITKKLSGWCNAATSADWTFYDFNVPAHNYDQILPILADCMRNCTFKQDLLNAEFKVVIQELKMNRDNYARSLILGLNSAIFADHPYHYPTIGFKQDIWEINQQNLLDFYHKHYVPNNATFVIVGDVNPDEVFAAVEKSFASIPADPTYKKESFYHNLELASQELVLYRDVKLPMLLLSYQIPGYAKHDGFAVDALSMILTGGKSSRLYKRLVDELQLVNWIQSFNFNYFDVDIVSIYCEPKSTDRAAMQQVINIIQEELDAIASQGLTAEELEKVMAQSKQAYYSMLENNNSQAKAIGMAYLARRDENYPFTFMYDDAQKLGQQIQNMMRMFAIPEFQHRGVLLPLSERGKQVWGAIMAQGDAEDVAFLAQRERKSQVEAPMMANEIETREPRVSRAVVPHTFQLPNGLKVFTHKRTGVPKMSVTLKLKANGAFNNPELPGLCNIISALMYEGTQSHPGDAFAEAAEQYGIHYDIATGVISFDVLPGQLQYGLLLLSELLMECSFDDSAIEKVKTRAMADWYRHLDTPKSMASLTIRETIYKGHPYGMSDIADPDTLAKISRNDIVAQYKAWMTPVDAKLVIVGDIDDATVSAAIKSTLSAWTGIKLADITYPQLSPIKAETLDVFMARDQIVLTYAGLSVNRMDPDFDKLLLFDHIFSRGMDSRLFHLREKYGIFYMITGSTIASADEQPGMTTVSTIVSKDRLAEAEALIENAIATVIDDIREDEIAVAKQTVLNDMAEMYATNRMTANTLLFLNKYNLPYDYAIQRAKNIQAITLDEVKEAARRVMQNDALIKVRVGRLDGAQDARPFSKAVNNVSRQAV